MSNRGTIIGAAWAVATLVLGSSATLAIPQDSEPKEVRKAESKKNDQKNGDHKNQSSTEFTLRVKVTAEGMTQLPSGSQLTLNGRAGCEELHRSMTLDVEGNGNFPRIPPCKAQIVVIITGFDTKMASVDLASYKDTPMRVHVSADGPPQVN